MDPDILLPAVHLWLIVTATVAATMFCVLYAWLTHGAWMRTRHGRHLMALTFGLGALGWNALVGDYPGEDYVEAAIYALLAWQLIRRDALLVEAQLKGETPIAPVDGGGRENPWPVSQQHEDSRAKD